MNKLLSWLYYQLRTVLRYCLNGLSWGLMIKQLLLTFNFSCNSSFNFLDLLSHQMVISFPYFRPNLNFYLHTQVNAMQWNQRTNNIPVSCISIRVRVRVSSFSISILLDWSMHFVSNQLTLNLCSLCHFLRKFQTSISINC